MKIVGLAGSVPVGDFGSMILPEALFPTKNNAVKLLRKLSGKNNRVLTDHPTILEHLRYVLNGFNNMAMGYRKIECFSDEQIEAIRVKVLFLVGEDDPFAKLGGKDALLQCKMNVQFFPEVGHGINHEISEEINQLLIGYLLDQTQ